MMKNKSLIQGIGVDLAKISRFENQSALAKKILSPQEYDIYTSHHQPSMYLAGRFAAKEAFIKALRKAPLPNLSTIEVLHEKDGAPYILFKKNRYHVSISHDGEYAVAMVII
jgi:holo-[acyl-carrier-protein] synthase